MCRVAASNVSHFHANLQHWTVCNIILGLTRFQFETFCVQNQKSFGFELIDFWEFRQEAWNARAADKKKFDLISMTFFGSWAATYKAIISIIHLLWALERMHNCIRKCSWSSIIPQTWTITKRNTQMASLHASWTATAQKSMRCDERNNKKIVLKS